jgi:hypothetical protein
MWASCCGTNGLITDNKSHHYISLSGLAQEDLSRADGTTLNPHKSVSAEAPFVCGEFLIIGVGKIPTGRSKQVSLPIQLQLLRGGSGGRKIRGSESAVASPEKSYRLEIVFVASLVRFERTAHCLEGISL